MIRCHFSSVHNYDIMTTFEPVQAPDLGYTGKTTLPTIELKHHIQLKRVTYSFDVNLKSSLDLLIDHTAVGKIWV